MASIPTTRFALFARDHPAWLQAAYEDKETLTPSQLAAKVSHLIVPNPNVLVSLPTAAAATDDAAAPAASKRSDVMGARIATLPAEQRANPVLRRWALACQARIGEGARAYTIMGYCVGSVQDKENFRPMPLKHIAGFHSKEDLAAGPPALESGNVAHHTLDDADGTRFDFVRVDPRYTIQRWEHMHRNELAALAPAPVPAPARDPAPAPGPAPDGADASPGPSVSLVPTAIGAGNEAARRRRLATTEWAALVDLQREVGVYVASTNNDSNSSSSSNARPWPFPDTFDLDAGQLFEQLSSRPTAAPWDPYMLVQALLAVSLPAGFVASVTQRWIASTGDTLVRSDTFEERAAAWAGDTRLWNDMAGQLAALMVASSALTALARCRSPLVFETARPLLVACAMAVRVVSVRRAVACLEPVHCALTQQTVPAGTRVHEWLLQWEDGRLCRVVVAAQCAVPLVQPAATTSSSVPLILRHPLLTAARLHIYLAGGAEQWAAATRAAAAEDVTAFQALYACLTRKAIRAWADTHPNMMPAALHLVRTSVRTNTAGADADDEDEDDAAFAASLAGASTARAPVEERHIESERALHAIADLVRVAQASPVAAADTLAPPLMAAALVALMGPWSEAPQ